MSFPPSAKSIICTSTPWFGITSFSYRAHSNHVNIKLSHAYLCKHYNLYKHIVICGCSHGTRGSLSYSSIVATCTHDGSLLLVKSIIFSLLFSMVTMIRSNHGSTFTSLPTTLQNLGPLDKTSLNQHHVWNQKRKLGPIVKEK